MPLIAKPVPFREAVAILQQRKVMPTSMTTAQLRGLSQAVRNQAFTSAQTTIESLLDDYKAKVESILNPAQVLREGAEQTVTEGYNPATARAAIKDFLKGVGYQPDAGTQGTLLDLSSDKRVNLMVDTNVKLSTGGGRFVQQNDANVVAAWPALELVRFEERTNRRDWEQRWRMAAAVSGDVDAARILEGTGRMVALKSSGIWQALGDGAGGYDDTLGNPFPPFAFNSGMWTEEVDLQEAQDLGLLNEGETAQPNDFDLTQLFAV